MIHVLLNWPQQGPDDHKHLTHWLTCILQLNARLNLEFMITRLQLSLNPILIILYILWEPLEINDLCSISSVISHHPLIMIFHHIDFSSSILRKSYITGNGLMTEKFSDRATEIRKWAWNWHVDIVRFATSPDKIYIDKKMIRSLQWVTS